MGMELEREKNDITEKKAVRVLLLGRRACAPRCAARGARQCRPISPMESSRQAKWRERLPEILKFAAKEGEQTHEPNQSQIGQVAKPTGKSTGKFTGKVHGQLHCPCPSLADTRTWSG